MNPSAHYGMIATFDTTPEITRAAGLVREAGFVKWDVYTPFPVHGLDAVMGEKRSRLGGLSLAGGVLGMLTGIALVAFMNLNYPLIVGGKPIFGIIFPFPIFYELTILLAAFGAFFGMFFLNRLPRHHHPVFEYDGFGASSDDKFMIVVEASDPMYDELRTKVFLESLGGHDVTLIPAGKASDKGGAR